MLRALTIDLKQTRAAIKSARLIIRGYFRPLTLTILIIVVLPYALTLALITSVGGMLQQSAYGIINSEAPSVYGAVYQDDITRLPGLRDWLLYGLSWPWLLCGLLIAILAVPQRKLWSIMIATAVIASFALTLIDLLLSGLAGGLNAQNIVGNLLGGPLAAVAASPALLLFIKLAGQGPPPKIARVVGGALAMVGWGAIVSGFAFLGFKILFQPVSQKLDVVLTRPLFRIQFWFGQYQ